MYRIGLIGCGNRLSSLLGHLEKEEDMVIAAVADPRVDDMAKKFEGKNAALYPDAESMLAAEALDGVMIGTRCSLHTPMALLAAKKGVPIFLEKPVSTSYEQLEALKALLPMSEKVVVSFPLRVGKIAETVKELLDSGVVGTVEHVQAYNNVYYGRGYYHKWYRDDKETGGLFLQKATHDVDYIQYLLGGNLPVRVCAMKSKQIFKGDMPAGQKCADCPKKKECPESPQNVAAYGSGSGHGFGEYCCFAVDTGNEDSGSCIIEYESGMHVVYSQNFFVRKGAGKRGARLMGYLGTLEFDFNTGVITVFRHNEDKTIRYEIGTGGGHGGGDAILVANFADVVRGKDVSHTTLLDGLRSADICLAARESADTKRFVDCTVF